MTPSREPPGGGQAARPRFLAPSIFLVSGVGIAYEIGLLRVFSVAQWHHFAYMIISVAMLGFAVSGTALALVRERIVGREALLYRLGALLLPVTLVGCHGLAQAVPFETFELAARPAEFWDLFALYLILSIPFFLVSWCIALGFLLEPARVGRVYFVNLVGAGAGAAAAVGLLYAVAPGALPLALSLPAGLAAAAALADDRGRRPAWAVGLLAAAVGVVVIGERPVRVSEYKGLSHALRLPDARVVAETSSPLSALTAVSSAQIRETPGQISGYPWTELGPLPRQVALFFDAGAVSPVHRFDGALEPFAFLDYVTSALPYRLVREPRVLVIGAGGGTEVLAALYQGAREVTAVEVDPGVFRIVRERFRDFSGRLYERPDVRPVVAEGRGFLEARRPSRAGGSGGAEPGYDVIQIALLDSFNAAAAGVHALSESYLYTVEALALYLESLSPGGVLSITRWLRTPPRDAIKMFASVVEAAERAGIQEPARHIAFLRSWNTGTIAVARSPLTPSQVEAVRGFAAERGLDLAWLPGLEPGEANRYTVLEQPVYYEAAARILSPEREAFYRDYPFYVRPATDDRPHFFRFFRWRSLPSLIQGLGAGWVSFVEWGYLALVATCLQALAAAGALVLLPLALFGRTAGPTGVPPSGLPGGGGPAIGALGGGPATGAPGGGPATGAPGRGATVLYFGALGLAFMFLEIAFIQKFMLFLHYPVYAVGVVLTAFLVFSGLGSYFADRRSRRGAWPRRVAGAVAGIAGLSVLYLAFLPGLFGLWSGWGDAGRIAASLGLLAPLAFAMGIPFPSGLQAVSDRRRGLVPWAWGVNGAASVVGATMAALTAVHFGFRGVVALAVLLYAGAALAARRLAAGPGRGGEPGAGGRDAPRAASRRQERAAGIPPGAPG